MHGPREGGAMGRVHVRAHGAVPPDRFVAALTDFGPGRQEIWGNSDPRHLAVHDRGDTWAEVTEGSGAARRGLAAHALRLVGARRRHPRRPRQQCLRPGQPVDLPGGARRRRRRRRRPDDRAGADARRRAGCSTSCSHSAAGPTSRRDLRRSLRRLESRLEVAVLTLRPPGRDGRSRPPTWGTPWRTTTTRTRSTASSPTSTSAPPTSTTCSATPATPPTRRRSSSR